MNRIARLSCFILLLVSVGGAPLPGEEYVTLTQAARLASRVAHVEVTDVQVREGAGGNIFTFIDFRVLDAAVGELPERFQARLLGGRIGNRSMELELVEPFERGRSYVLLLGSNNSLGYVTIFPQGIFPVVGDEGSRRVRTHPGMPLFKSDSGKAYAYRPDVVPLEDFLFSLGRMAGKGEGR